MKRAVYLSVCLCLVFAAQPVFARAPVHARRAT